MEALPSASLLEEVDDRAWGNVVVEDGLGSAISVPPGETRGFPLKLDEYGQFVWRQEGQTGNGPFCAPQRGMPRDRATNFIQVTRARDGRGIKWAYYYDASLCASPEAESPYAVAFAQGPGISQEPPASAAPQAAGDIFGGRSLAPSDQAASDLSAKQLLHATSSAAIQIQRFIEEAPHRANQLCIAGGLLIMLKSAVGLLGIGELVTSPMVYVVNGYLMFFGIVTIVSEVQPDFAPVAHDRVESLQTWMHEWALGLKELWGRGLFYFFQGTLALVSSSSIFSLGVLVGPCMMILGIYFIYLYKQRRSNEAEGRSLPQDYIRLE